MFVSCAVSSALSLPGAKLAGPILVVSSDGQEPGYPWSLGVQQPTSAFGKGSGSQWVTGSSNATPSYRAPQLLLCPAAPWGFQGGLGHSKLCHIGHPMPCSAKTSHTTLTSRPIPLQGIERLQRKTQPREHSGSWKSVQEAFGGDFSLNWFNPFTRPCQPVIPIDKGLVRQVSSLSDMDNMETTESQLEETKDRDSVEVLDE